MSLILEALRKSEAERRLGESPDLRTELPPVAPARGIHAPRWTRAWTLAALGLLAIAIAWLAWLRPWTPGIPPAVSDVAVDQPAAPPDTPPEPASRATAQATVIPADAGRARVAGPPPAVDGGADTPDGSTGSTIATAPREARVEVATEAPAPSASAPQPVQSRAVPRQADAVPAPDTVAPPPATGAPLTLAELTPAQRRALPPLKVSMHMWSAEPARRFVILDGRRMAEGDRAGAVVVDTIGRDDVLLAWEGQLLRLSLR